jgi:ubiquinol-cytochrome c reductase iron-sulfur subunit
MSSPKTTKSRLRPRPRGRSFVVLVTLASWLLGFGAGAWAMLDSMNPSSDLRTPHWVDLSDIPEGGRKTVYWGRLPIYIAHRTPEQNASVKRWDEEYAGWTYHPFGERDEERVQREEWSVVIGRDSMRDCLVTGQDPKEDRGEWGGWHSPCSGISYDTSGRAHMWEDYFNLWVPSYRFTGDTEIAFPHQYGSH